MPKAETWIVIRANYGTDLPPEVPVAKTFPSARAALDYSKAVANASGACCYPVLLPDGLLLPSALAYRIRTFLLDAIDPTSPGLDPRAAKDILCELDPLLHS